MGRTKDITGERFGSLTALSLSGFSKGLSRIAIWKCVCDCGQEQLAYVTKLLSGSTISCKQCGYKRGSAARTTHGLTHDPTYVSWKSMKARCMNPESPDYERYGGRGIKVCERWLDFELFVSDMGARPRGTSLERNDTDGNYEPGNCRWATPAEQANNRSSNRRVTWMGEQMSLSEFGRRIGMDHRKVRYSIVIKGMTPEQLAKEGGYGKVSGSTRK